MTVRARDLHNAAAILQLIARDLPHLETHIATQRAQTNGYPTNTGEPSVTTTTDTSTTERNALTLLNLTDQWASIQIALHSIVDTTNTIARTTQRALATHTATTTPRAIILCDGRNMEGFPTWGEACYNTADKAGLCHKHYMRARRWRQDNDRPPLDPDR